MSRQEAFSDAGHIKAIDGLRAVAVISVMLFHLDATWLPGGFAGVDVFFVISGFVVSASLARHAHSGFVEYLVGFYARRVVRILPALLACLTITTILATLFIPASWLSTAASKTGLMAFFGMSNFALIWFADGYFSPQAEFNAFTHTWSLAVEEQFYLVHPLLLIVWIRSMRRGEHPQGRATAAGRVLIPALILASLAYSAYETKVAPANAYYLLPSRFWELGVGAALFMLINQSGASGLTRRANGSLQVFGLLVMASGLMLSDSAAFPFPWALLSVTGTALVIYAVAGRTIPNDGLWLLENPGAAYFGKISYSLYLWHCGACQ